MQLKALEKDLLFFFFQNIFFNKKKTNKRGDHFRGRFDSQPIKQVTIVKGLFFVCSQPVINMFALC